MFVVRQCAVNDMQPIYFKAESHHSILTYVDPLNPIYVMYYTHGCFGIIDFPKRTHVNISVAEALIYGPILIK